MASEPKLRGLPEAVEVTLFRILDQTIRADPITRDQVKVFRSWEGKADDKTPPSTDQAPWVRLSMKGSAEKWWSSDSQTGALTVLVEIFVTGTCSDDIANLWFAIKRSLYPQDPVSRSAFVKRLTDAGAHKGLVEFTAPAYDAAGGDDGSFYATAALRVEYRVNYWS